MEKEISCRTTNAIIRYVRERLGSATSLLQGLPYSESFLTDTNNWVSYELLRELHQKLHQLFEEPDILYYVGQSTNRLSSLGIINFLVRLFATPQMVYNQAVKFNGYFNRIIDIRVLETTPSSADVEFIYRSTRYHHKDNCDYGKGILAAIPDIWGIGHVRIDEEQCMVPIDQAGMIDGKCYRVGPAGEVYEVPSDEPEAGAPDASATRAATGADRPGLQIGRLDSDGTYLLHGTRYGAPLCRYKVTWPRWRTQPARIWHYIFRQPVILRETIAQLETDQAIIQEKHDELQRLNETLAAANQKLNALNAELEASNRSLHETQRELEEYQGKLESRVEERTRALRETQAQLIQSAKMASIGRLVAAIAHEVNNPLAIIQTSLMIMGQTMDGSDAKQVHIQTVNKEIDRISLLLRQLLDYSRPAKAECFAVELNKVVEDTIRMLSNALRAHHIQLETRMTSDSTLVNASPNQIKQVLFNLATNAIDAIGEGGLIAIETRQCKEAVELIIKDTGPGINKKDFPYIFDPFFTTKRGQGGVGLGLSISFNIIQNFGGTISARNREEGGACFTVSLPLSCDSGR